MSPVDLRIDDARVVTPNGMISGGVAIDDGRIVEVGDTSRLPSADETIDAAGRVVLPGVIDPHVHLGLSGYGPQYHDALADEFETETRGAVHGGVTTVVDFLLQPEPYAPDMETFRRIGEEHSYIDFAFHAIVHKDHHVEEMDDLVDAGVTSFKVFFNMYKHTSTELGIEPSEAGRLYRVLRAVADVPGGIVLVHNENDDLNAEVTPEVRAEGGDDLAAWARACPAVAETIQVEALARLTDYADSRAYAVHVSAAESVDVLRRHQEAGVDIHGETLAIHLIHDTEDDVGLWGKVSPPVRGPRHRQALWRGLQSGVIDHVGTDHVSSAIAGGLDKEEVGAHSIWDARVGRPGMEYLLPVLLSEGVNRGRLSLERVAAVCSTNTAKRFDLYPRKGVVAPGADADLVIVDLEQRTVVDDETFFHTREPRWSSLHGRELTGLPTHTIIGGEVVVEDGKLVAEPGGRSYLSRPVEW